MHDACTMHGTTYAIAWQPVGTQASHLKPEGWSKPVIGMHANTMWDTKKYVIHVTHSQRLTSSKQNILERRCARACIDNRTSGR